MKNNSKLYQRSATINNIKFDLIFAESIEDQFIEPGEVLEDTLLRLKTTNGIDFFLSIVLFVPKNLNEIPNLGDNYLDISDTDLGAEKKRVYFTNYGKDSEDPERTAFQIFYSPSNPTESEKKIHYLKIRYKLVNDCKLDPAKIIVRVKPAPPNTLPRGTRGTKTSAVLIKEDKN